MRSEIKIINEFHLTWTTPENLNLKQVILMWFIPKKKLINITREVMREALENVYKENQMQIREQTNERLH